MLVLDDAVFLRFCFAVKSEILLKNLEYFKSRTGYFPVSDPSGFLQVADPRAVVSSVRRAFNWCLQG